MHWCCAAAAWLGDDTPVGQFTTVFLAVPNLHVGCCCLLACRSFLLQVLRWVHAYCTCIVVTVLMLLCYCYVILLHACRQAKAEEKAAQEVAKAERLKVSCSCHSLF
jgi:heme/copper-type cytochrome/quinol oxidase subunit 2